MAYPRGVESNLLELTDDGIWVLSSKRTIPYSDGARSEDYLHQVFGSAADLSSDSYELEDWIKDWPSEYHLSRKRSQLLRGFEFRRSDAVLEVGCGCGAITRFLGETFDEVTAVEGGLRRAQLARLRTRDQPGVTVICAPFQELEFEEQFDVVFCIGVLEYSGSFVRASDPYDAFLARMARALKPGGRLFLAIENQFGLKYFTSAREDHTNLMFEGIEDYPRYGAKVRTFGRGELEGRILRHFTRCKFYFPYPDYKIPDVLVSEDFLDLSNAAGALTRAPSRDYGMPMRPLFDERRAALALGRNQQLAFFANSFLVQASRGDAELTPFMDLGRMYSSGRPAFFAMTTRICRGASGQVVVSKERSSPGASIPVDVPVRVVPSEVEWQQGVSLHDRLLDEVARHSNSGVGKYDHCRPWLDALRDKGNPMATESIPGRYLDAVFQNTFIVGGKCRFIDLEWEWGERLSLPVIVIRAFYLLFADLAAAGKGAMIGHESVRTAIIAAAEEIGIRLSSNDFLRFLDVESRLCAAASINGSASRARWRIKLFLISRRSEPVINSLRLVSLRCRLQRDRVIRAVRRLGRLKY